MVVGMELFKKHFRGYEEYFVVIGGAACDEWFTHEGLSFRVTKDVDMVVLLEANNTRFIERFWEFINAGQYSNRQRSTGDRVYYRFTEPNIAEYPLMLELFVRNVLGLELEVGQHIVPIPVDEDISSLSGILLDDAYYKIVLAGKSVVDDLSVVRPDTLILLKAKAWLDLNERRNNGETIKGDDIKKHRNDVFRLAHILTVGESISIPKCILDDLLNFLDKFPADDKVWDAITTSVKSTISPPMTPLNLLYLLHNYYQSE
ncbi:MAG: hypothetical protein KAH23_09930 [Kiritimatiellae bacterium]|nr:hypothetical protein [Kiritimatiellia bacterium]